MCNELEFTTAIKDGGLYYPPTYSSDGFVHAAKDAAFLLTIGNAYYKTSIGNWILLVLDENKFDAGVVRYEPAAPVGGVKADYASVSASVPHFPHIYSGIRAMHVVERRNIVRDAAGNFLTIEGI